MISDTVHERFVRACVAGDNIGVASAIADGLILDALDREGRAPLHYAASARNLDAAQQLLAAGASIDIADRNGNTPLSDAIFYAEGQTELIQFLLNGGANPHCANAHGVSPAQLADSIANYDYRGLFS